jgi:hypothetical protein
MKDGSIFILIPAAFVVTTVVVTLFSRASKGHWLNALGNGIMMAGLVTAAVEFFVLLPILKKGTDGPGGLIVFVLPIVTVLVTTFASTLLLSFGGLVSASQQQDAQKTLSPQATAILNLDSRYMSPMSHLPLSASWRDYARARNPVKSRN